MPRTNYHHGALRDALLRATLDLIRTEGIGAVSLRQVARTAGVSPGAPYHHFPDRAALLTALADDGFKNLATALRTTQAEARTPAEALPALIETYVRFAHDNPAHFQLMFRPELTQSHKSPQGKEAADEAFTALTDTVAACMAAGVLRQADEDVLALTLWSLVHGLASLWLDGHLAHHTGDPEELTRQVARLVAGFMTTSAP
ncbi:TetR/AcrR family transcriptional regulator [Actinophytocola sp. NPDC049390]|uniref:TetR/AcrR family transcriptional regulator n=1 Tax=Actinophytocola sp. NPDC049390 TaxID=3363894 RepID=UPI0037B34887